MAMNEQLKKRFDQFGRKIKTTHTQIKQLQTNVKKGGGVNQQLKRKFNNKIKNVKIKDELKSATIIALVAIACFIVTYASVFEILYPFGMSMVIAMLITGNKRLYLVSILSAIIGYSLTPNAPLYIIAIFGVVAMYFLYISKAKKINATLITICGSLLCVAARLTFMLASEPSVYSVIMSVCEGVIIGSCAYFFYKAFPIISGKKYASEGVNEQEQLCIIISLCVILLSLSFVNIYGASIARCLAVLITITLSYFGGAALGCMTGAVAGITLSLAGAPQGLYIVASYAFGGMLGSFFSNFSKVATALAFVVSGSIVTLYINATTGEMISLVEILVAGLLFIIIPQKYLRAFSSIIISNKSPENTKDKIKEIFLDKIYSTSNSFKKISGLISKNSIQNHTPNITDGLVLAAENSCKKCGKNSACWGIYYNDTIDVFNKLCNKYISNGVLKQDDLPKYFINRCDKNNELLNQLNAALAKKEQECAGEEILKQNRHLLADQYASVGEIIDNIANELDITVKFDYLSQHRIINALSREDADCNAICYTDADGMYTCEITVKWKNKVPENNALLAVVSEICGIELEIITSNMVEKEQKIKLCEKENISVICTAASIGKDNKAVCGDTVSSFNTGKGKYIIAISDGMGTGISASRDSALTVSFLEQLLRAGFPKESALKLVNSALILKSDDEECATIDIAAINLVTGHTEFLKAGAAPSFVKHKNNVFKLGCSTLPAGIMNTIDFEKNECYLKGGDILLMVSDGVTASSEKQISEILFDYKGDDLNTLVMDVLTKAMELNDMPDDLTAIAARVVKNKAS